MRYQAIDHHRGQYPVRWMCRWSAVSHSGYYAWLKHKQRIARESAELLAQIKAIHADSRGVFGSPRVQQALALQGVQVSVYRVARLMRENQIAGIPKRKWRAGRKRGQRPLDVRDHTQRDFTADAPNVKWVIDITEFKTAEGKLYLAALMELFSREIIGWSMQAHMAASLAIAAVQMALMQRDRSQPVILHSDRGTQFTSKAYQAFLKANKVICSMGAVGSCYDNAAMESFFSLLKRECTSRKKYATRAELRADVFDYIERFYNRQRPHSHNQGLPPAKRAGNELFPLNQVSV